MMSNMIHGSEKQIAWAKKIKSKNIEHLRYMIAAHVDLASDVAKSPTKYVNGEYEVINPDAYVEDWRSFQSEKICEKVLGWWENADDARQIIDHRDKPLTVFRLMIGPDGIKEFMLGLEAEFESRHC